MLLVPVLLISAMQTGWFDKPPPPIGNPFTAEKNLLGRALFWDEQLSSSNSVACGSCHMPEAGGTDPNSMNLPYPNPGPDGIFGTPDDIRGSVGLNRVLMDGSFDPHPDFGFGPQITGRKPPPTINALFGPVLFWDGRASGRFSDPISGEVTLALFAALESQAAGPPVGDGEMAAVGRTWVDIENKLSSGVRALALSPSVTPDLAPLHGQDYNDLFEKAYGSPGITAQRIIFAIATYERSLYADQTPFDRSQRGDTTAMNAQQSAGQAVFEGNGLCIQCHVFPTLGRDQFQYIGARPDSADIGLEAVTGLAADRGKLLVPDLRNISLRAPFLAHGELDTLEEVVDLYDRGGDFTSPNISTNIQVLNLTQQEKDDLVEFMRTALLDPRVAAQTPPFDRPLLHDEGPTGFQAVGAGTPGAGGFTPRFITDGPGVPGQAVSIGIQDGQGGAPAVLAWDKTSSAGVPFKGVTVYLGMSPDLRSVNIAALSGSGDGNGYATAVLDLPRSRNLIGAQFYLQWFVKDGSGSDDWCSSAAVLATLP